MAENIRKVFPPVVGTSIGHWYDDTDLERYNRVIKILEEYQKGTLDEHDVRWFVKCAILSKVYLSEDVYKLGNQAWKNPNNKRLQNILTMFAKQGYITDKEIDIEKYRNGVRFEHMVPYNEVIKVLLGLYTKGLLTFEKFQMIRSKLNICLVTKDEERKLNVFKQAMPGNTDWLNISGDEFARYKAVGIKIYGFSQMP